MRQIHTSYLVWKIPFALKTFQKIDEKSTATFNIQNLIDYENTVQHTQYQQYTTDSFPGTNEEFSPSEISPPS